MKPLIISKELKEWEQTIEKIYRCNNCGVKTNYLTKERRFCIDCEREENLAHKKYSICIECLVSFSQVIQSEENPNYCVACYNRNCK